MRLSIGMPVYNGENYVAEAIKSILDQTYGEFRLFISDNGSTDATYDVCRELASGDDRIEVVRHEQNRGAAWNYEQVRERGAGSELFKWAAHDDVLAPTFLERCIDALDEHPDVVLAFTGVAAIDDNGNVTRIKHRQVHPVGATPARRFRQVVMSAEHCNSVFGVMRGAALRNTRGHGAYVAADRVLLAELAVQGPFFEVPEVLFFNRDHAMKSTMAIADARMRSAWFDTRRSQQLLPYWRLWREYLEAARRAPITEGERREVYAQLPWFLPRFGRKLAGDVPFGARVALAARRRAS